jgi:hypothetical protein
MRHGVSVHTIHSLEKSRPYVELNKIEKEILALNLIKRNPFFLKRMTLSDMIVKKHYQKEKKEVYEIAIPDAWLQQKLDLYIVSIDPTSKDENIEKNSWLAETAGKTIELDAQGNPMIGFVVINPKAQAALLLKPETEKIDTPVVEKVPEIRP